MSSKPEIETDNLKDSLKVYADEKYTEPISTIEWNIDTIITLITGAKFKLPNTAKAGDVITTTVWIRNESKYNYGIMNISFPDSRVEIAVKQPILRPNEATKLTIQFTVPEKPTEKDVIKSGKITIEGYYVYTA